MQYSPDGWFWQKGRLAAGCLAALLMFDRSWHANHAHHAGEQKQAKCRSRFRRLFPSGDMLNLLMLPTSIITLDFEASSLAETGYPIEVAVVIGDRHGSHMQFSTLIAPRPEWRGRAHWSEASQAIHGIAFEWLSDAMPAETVCDTLDLLLADRSVFVDGGTYDQFWLDRLYSGRPIPFRLDHLQGLIHENSSR